MFIFKLDDVIRAPGNNQHQEKMDANLQSTIAVVLSVGIMDTLKFVFSYKK